MVLKSYCNLWQKSRLGKMRLPRFSSDWVLERICDQLRLTVPKV